MGRVIYFENGTGYRIYRDGCLGINDLAEIREMFQHNKRQIK